MFSGQAWRGEDCARPLRLDGWLGAAGLPAKPHPAPLGLLVLVAQLPGLLAVRLHAQVQAIAIELAIFTGLGFDACQSGVAERAALDFGAFHVRVSLLF